MRLARTVEEVRTYLAEAREKADMEGKDTTVGFVPTMGYLHNGHASLMRRARMECGIAVLSIFVNPIQFGPNEDFDRYPRNEEGDLALAEANGIDLVFMPDVTAMYPKPIKTKVTVSERTEGLCGASRPGHFDGVATVVTKLFNIVKPDRAYFGMKDAQQVAVIEQMVQDLNQDVTIVPCPIVREADGLALSSRNVYLTKEERKEALVLSQALDLTEEWFRIAEGNVDKVKEEIVAYIQTSPLSDIDYVEIVTYPELLPASGLSHEELLHTGLLVALAVRFGKTRLIDNRLFHPIHEPDYNEGRVRYVSHDDEGETAQGNRYGSKLELCR